MTILRSIAISITFDHPTGNHIVLLIFCEYCDSGCTWRLIAETDSTDKNILNVSFKPVTISKSPGLPGVPVVPVDRGYHWTPSWARATTRSYYGCHLTIGPGQMSVRLTVVSDGRGLQQQDRDYVIVGRVNYRNSNLSCCDWTDFPPTTLSLLTSYKTKHSKQHWKLLPP